MMEEGKRERRRDGTGGLTTAQCQLRVCITCVAEGGVGSGATVNTGRATGSGHRGTGNGQGRIRSGDESRSVQYDASTAGMVMVLVSDSARNGAELLL